MNYVREILCRHFSLHAHCTKMLSVLDTENVGHVVTQMVVACCMGFHPSPSPYHHLSHAHHSLKPHAHSSQDERSSINFVSSPQPSVKHMPLWVTPLAGTTMTDLEKMGSMHFHLLLRLRILQMIIYALFSVMGRIFSVSLRIAVRCDVHVHGLCIVSSKNKHCLEKEHFVQIIYGELEAMFFTEEFFLAHNSRHLHVAIWAVEISPLQTMLVKWIHG